MRPFAPRLRPATLALAGSLALTLAGCQRETKTVEQTPPPPPQQTEVTQAAPTPAPPAAAEPDRRAAELGQNPQTVVIPPERPSSPPPDARREGLAAREKRLAARQAELDRRERRLREQERSQGEAAPAPAPEPAAADQGAPAAPQPEMAPEPAPAPPAVTLPAGTTVDMELTRTLSSATSRVGDTFRARVAKDVYGEDGDVAIPAGSEIVGEVSQAVPLKKIGGQASLGLRFTDLVLPSGETVPIQASLARQGANETGRAAAKIGGAAAAGGILGNILNRGDRGRGSVIGALIGAAVGTAIAARTKGEEIEIPQGSVIGLVLDQPVRVHRRP